jgi:hypothetical protein
VESTDELAGPAGPKIYTFTCRLPFVLGFSDNLTHRIDLSGGYVDPADVDAFGPNAYVNIRMFNAQLADYKSWPVNMPSAVHHFYAGEIGPPDDEHPLYEQWISLETPGGLTHHENPSDPAYTFHRCLGALNIFLQALGLARQDDRLRPVSARELRPIVIIGAITADRQWNFISPMLMHPDAKERPLEKWAAKAHLERLELALSALFDGEPFIPSRQWRARAERRRHEGDAADSVISFQIAAETLLYATWRMIMVDDGLTADEITERAAGDLPFKSLLVRELHGKLGGTWDVTRPSSPVGAYWRNLYGRRNQILHAGYQPHDGDSEEAENAFLTLEEFVEERLWRNYRRFPRTMLAKLGREELEKRGWMTRWMANFARQTEEEPGRFFLPRDVAGR